LLWGTARFDVAKSLHRAEIQDLRQPTPEENKRLSIFYFRDERPMLPEF